MERSMTYYENNPFVLNIRGLPWSATKNDILQFFAGCKIRNGLSGIHLTMSRDRRPSGEAYIEFETTEDAIKGLERNKQCLGSRYIDVFPKKQYEMAWANENDYDPSVLRVRGLDWAASKNDIVQFFDGCNIKNGRNGIHFITGQEDGPNREAYIEFETEDDAKKGLAKNNEHLGSRYIEVFRTMQNEMGWTIRSGDLQDDCLLLRGLPFGCSKVEIMNFFTGFEVVRNGITLFTEYEGQSTGVAYVQFASPEVAQKAMEKHKGKIGSYSIDIFKSNHGTGHNVYMRGVPYKIDEREIFTFFATFAPIGVRKIYEPSGRPSGNAVAMFASHADAVRAMQKDKAKIQKRYIELFLQSEPDI